MGQVTKWRPSSAAASRRPIFDPPFEEGFARVIAPDDGEEGLGEGGGRASEDTPDFSMGSLGIGGARGTTTGLEPFNFVTSLFTLSLKEPIYTVPKYQASIL